MFNNYQRGRINIGTKINKYPDTIDEFILNNRIKKYNFS